MANPAPWTARIFELIEDAPRPRDWLLREVSGLVPPGRAWRSREASRLNSAWWDGRDATIREPTDKAIRSGQRIRVRASINSLVQAGRLVQFEQDGQVMIGMGRPAHVKTFAEASASARKAAATRHKSGYKPRPPTDEERAAIAERSRRAWAALTDEQRAARARKIKEKWDAQTPEQRAERHRKGVRTRYGR